MCRASIEFSSSDGRLNSGRPLRRPWQAASSNSALQKRRRRRIVVHERLVMQSSDTNESAMDLDERMMNPSVRQQSSSSTSSQCDLQRGRICANTNGRLKNCLPCYVCFRCCYPDPSLEPNPNGNAFNIERSGLIGALKPANRCCSRVRRAESNSRKSKIKTDRRSKLALANVLIMFPIFIFLLETTPPCDSASLVEAAGKFSGRKIYFINVDSNRRKIGSRHE